MSWLYHLNPSQAKRRRFEKSMGNSILEGHVVRPLFLLEALLHRYRSTEASRLLEVFSFKSNAVLAQEDEGNDSILYGTPLIAPFRVKRSQS